MLHSNLTALKQFNRKIGVDDVLDPSVWSSFAQPLLLDDGRHPAVDGVPQSRMFIAPDPQLPGAELHATNLGFDRPPVHQR